MRIDREQIMAVGDQLGDVYRKAEARLVTLLRDARLTEWQAKRARQQLEAIRGVLEELGETTTTWGQMHLPGMYRAGMGTVDEAFRAETAAFSTLHRDSIRLLAEQIAANYEGVLTAIGSRISETFRTAQLNALLEATVLGETRREATRKMVEALIDEGLHAVPYRNADGSIRAYHSLGDWAEIAARTGTREVYETGLENRMAELGRDLVQVSTHGGACPLCTPWEGKILSLSGENPDYPSKEEAMAAGLFHPRCVHVSMPYTRFAESRPKAIVRVQ